VTLCCPNSKNQLYNTKFTSHIFICVTKRGQRVEVYIVGANMRERDHLEDLGVDGRQIQCVRKVAVHLGYGT
jgi:hypothetical protein